MTLTSDEIEETFIIFMAGELSLKDIEQWLYNTPEVEDYLGESAYLELVSFNFRQSAANYEFNKLISGYILQTKYKNWDIKRLLKSLLDGTQDPVLVFNHLYWIYLKDYGFLYNIAITNVLGIDEIPTLKAKNLWNEKEFLLQREKLDEYVDPLKEEIMTILEALETGEIKLLEKNDYLITPELSERLEKLQEKQRVEISKRLSAQQEIPQKTPLPKRHWWKFWQN